MKSPLKDKSLNNPGESLERHIEEFKEKELLEPLMGVAFLVMLTVYEWIRWYFNLPMQPGLMTLIAAIGIILLIRRIIKIRVKLKSLRQGLEGERSVGQFLELLRESGAKVFHDIPGQGFNVDHIVIHQNGIYVIETKTYSKPDKGEAAILYDGKSLRISEKLTTSDPLIQVKAATSWVQQLLLESTGSKFNLKPVLVFPGWYIQSSAEAMKSDVWVLNPKALPAFIENQKPQLAADKVHMLALHLSRYIRSSKK